MNKIIDPINNKTYRLNSNEGRNLLKNYISFFLKGGTQQGPQKPTFVPSQSLGEQMSNRKIQGLERQEEFEKRRTELMKKQQAPPKPPGLWQPSSSLEKQRANRQKLQQKGQVDFEREQARIVNEQQAQPNSYSSSDKIILNDGYLNAKTGEWQPRTPQNPPETIEKKTEQKMPKSEEEKKPWYSFLKFWGGNINRKPNINKDNKKLKGKRFGKNSSRPTALPPECGNEHKLTEEMKKKYKYDPRKKTFRRYRKLCPDEKCNYPKVSKDGKYYSCISQTLPKIRRAPTEKMDDSIHDYDPPLKTWHGNFE